MASLSAPPVKGLWSSLKQKWQARRIKRQRVQLRQLLGRLTLGEKWLHERRQRAHSDSNYPQ